jgi:ATP-dependent helicase HrpB
MNRSAAEYPIEELYPELRRQIPTHRRFILKSPTGSGKSTQLPPFLLDSGLVPSGQIIVLQPRRLPTRMLARRIAEERNQPLGKEVGFQIRFQRVASEQTRILFITEGILLRKMEDDPTLKDVGAILFDEFHERHLYSDVSLALALECQKTHRPDLLIGVLSATLDIQFLEAILSPCALFESDGRTFPVTIQYAANSAAVKDKPIWEHAAWHCHRLMEMHPSGDVLIFMPGSFEIVRTLKALEGFANTRDAACFALYGELAPEKQDEAVRPNTRRKIIVSTNVAETSLTIPGIEIVIDSGLAKIASFDPHRGINTLLTQKISQASAEQRAGRAGRTAPGHCLRLWSEREHIHRPMRLAAEIHRLDLSEIVLRLSALGQDPETFNWIEPPPPLSLSKANDLLAHLGACVPKSNTLTAIGRAMVAFPTHPRLARILIEAAQLRCLRPITLILGLMEGRELLLPLQGHRAAEREHWIEGYLLEGADIFWQLAAFQWAAQQHFDYGFCAEWGIHHQACRQAASVADQLFSISLQQALEPESEQSSYASADLRRCLLMGYADQVCRRPDPAVRRCLLSNGTSAEISKDSHLRAPLFVSCDIEERENARGVNIQLGMNVAIERGWLETLFSERFQSKSRSFFDATERRICAFNEIYYDQLLIEQIPSQLPDLESAAAILATEVESGRLVLKHWNEDADRWIYRSRYLARFFPELGILPITDDDKHFLLQQICHGAFSYKDIKDRPVLPMLHQWVSEAQLPLFESHAPLRLTLENGATVRLRYEQDGSVVLSAKIQSLYDLKNVQIMQRVTPKFELLAPNQRPIQITDDLEGFWSRSYPEIKKQLKGRYPKHEWR